MINKYYYGKHLIDSKDIISGVDFLLSNNYMTGHNLNINGGL